MPTYDIAGEVCRVCQADLIADQGVKRCGTCGLPAEAPLTQGTMPRGAVAVIGEADLTIEAEAEREVVSVESLPYTAPPEATAQPKHQRRRQ